ncbi:hypothetical protein ACHAXT_009377 [Thalassiosira profunda]
MASPPPSSADRLRSSIARVAALMLASAIFSGSEAGAFGQPTARPRPPSVMRSSSAPPSCASSSFRVRGSTTSISASRDQAHSMKVSSGMDVDVGEEQQCYPIQIHHQGHVATISVREDEPILQALERQSTISGRSSTKNSSNTDDETAEEISTLALSSIPHECRRGNCLTCSARVKPNSNTNNLQSNVNNGLSDTISTELTNSGYALTCCSYVTGPGVSLELEENDDVWDAVYRRRICPSSQKMTMAAQARLLRRVDEDNVGRWKRRMEQGWEGEE